MDGQSLKYYNDFYDILSEGKSRYEFASRCQAQVWYSQKPEYQPLLLSVSLPKEYKDFVEFTPKDVHFDKEKMLLKGMKEMLTPCLGKMQSVPSLRANMGCSIFPSLFPGIVPLLFDDGKMPWVKTHLDKETLKKLRPSDIKITDEFKMGLEHMAYFSEKIAGSGCFVFPLDLQGAVDTAHIVYGDQFFYDLYDDPDFIHHLLDLSVHAICLGWDECLKVIPKSAYIAHYNELVLPSDMGGIKVSEDTSTLLCLEHIQEYTVPYLKQVLDYAGGGYVHYCGKNDHLFDEVMKIDNAYGLNFGNPEKQDMDKMLTRCAENGKVYYGKVPQNEGESYEDYFLRCLKASEKDGLYKLLLKLSVPIEKRDEVHKAWDAALAKL